MPSTVIRGIDYDPARQVLVVTFVSGRCYRYSGVPEGVAQAFRAAVPKGRFFNARIRDAYPCEEVEQPYG